MTKSKCSEREEHPPDHNPMISVFADNIMPQDWSTPLLFVLTSDLRSEELSQVGDCQTEPAKWELFMNWDTGHCHPTQPGAESQISDNIKKFSPKVN